LLLELPLLTLAAAANSVLPLDPLLQELVATWKY
jgi:hypothetical protein